MLEGGSRSGDMIGKATTSDRNREHAYPGINSDAAIVPICAQVPCAIPTLTQDLGGISCRSANALN